MNTDMVESNPLTAILSGREEQVSASDIKEKGMLEDTSFASKQQLYKADESSNWPS